MAVWFFFFFGKKKKKKIKGQRLSVFLMGDNRDAPEGASLQGLAVINGTRPKARCSNFSSE
jgi:hypothetical protein